MVFRYYSFNVAIKSLRFFFGVSSVRDSCHIIKKTIADTFTVDVVFSSTGIVKDLGTIVSS